MITAHSGASRPGCARESRSSSRREGAVNRALEIERVGNLIAAALALFWFGRGVLIFSSSARAVGVEAFESCGVPASLLADLLPTIHALYFALGLLVVLRPAQRWALILQALWALIIVGLVLVAEPSSLVRPLLPIPKTGLLLMMLFILWRLGGDEPDLASIARSLARALAATAVASALVLFWLGEGALPSALPEPPLRLPRSPRLLFGLASLLAALGLSLLLVRGATPLRKLLALASATAAILAPPLLALESGPSILQDPLGPAFFSLLIVACAATLWFLDGNPSLAFRAALASGRRTDATVARLAHWTDLPSVAVDSQSRADGLKGLDPQSESRFAAIGACGYIAGGLLRAMPPGLRRRPLSFLLSRAARRYLSAAELSDASSLSRPRLEAAAAQARSEARALSS